MYKRYYDSYRPPQLPCSDKGEVITPRCTKDTYCKKECQSNDCPPENNQIQECENALPQCCENECQASKSLFSLPLEADDIILAVILILLLSEGDSVDPVMLIIIGLVLFSDAF